MKEENTLTAPSTIDPEEIERFSRIAGEWWDVQGKFKPLHQINPVRIQFILDQVAKWRGGEVAQPLPLQGLTLLDIGCGGGLISEPMCRLGAKVTGIDASEKNIKVAGLHAQQGGLNIDYRCMGVEELVAGWQGDEVAKEDKSASPRHHATTLPLFDIVLALEIIEHVADIPAFVAACCTLVKPGGLMVWSTINRTPKSYALAIVGAEYVLRWLPRGTHTWSKFVRPSELHSYLRHNGLQVTEMTGMTMNPLNFKWQLSKTDLSVNYLLVARKQG